MPINLFGLFDRGQSVKLVEEIPSGTKVIGGITGQVTAHGTVTAAINNVVTAESRGQVTAVGTVTAEVKGTITAETRGFVTAQVTAGWPIGVTGGPIGVTGEVTARGEITAHGTVTAAINNIVTAESRGQITAVGTVTAEVKGTVTAETRGFVTAQVSGGWPIGVTGEVTAHGTITAAVSNVVTAESRGQVTAVGTVTAEVKGTLTAQVGTVTAESRGFVTAQLTGGWPIVVRKDWISSYVITTLANTGTGQAVDARAYPNAGYMHAWASGCSASASLLASFDSATWMPVSAIGLAVNGTATAQLSGMYPFLCGRVDNAYNDGGGATAITAMVSMHVTKT